MATVEPGTVAKSPGLVGRNYISKKNQKIVRHSDRINIVKNSRRVDISTIINLHDQTNHPRMVRLAS